MIKLQVFFLVIILSTEICHSIIPIERSAQSSILADKKLFFFGGMSSQLLSSFNQILYLDVSKPFNTTNPPFEILNVSIPFRSSYATALFSPLKNEVYLFGGFMRNELNDDNMFGNHISVLISFNLENNGWNFTFTKTNGIAPENRRLINGVINNKTGKFYIFGGVNDTFTGATTNSIAFNDMNIFDTISLTWSKGSAEGSPLPLIGYTATLLSNGIIVFIGGEERPYNYNVSLNQLALYDTKVDQWSSMRAQGITLENRSYHSAVLTSDERIIVFGGDNFLNQYQLAVLNTKVVPYEWSVPTPAPPLPLTTYSHSATLVGNYMFINFGKVDYVDSNHEQLPYFYILDIRNFTWVAQYEPEQLSQLPNSTNTVNTSTTNSPGLSVETPSDNDKKIGIIIGAVGLSVVTVAGLLIGYKYYKKQRVHRYAKQAKQCVSYN
ncbi:unnamed protein product [Rhizophagus irregularis]|uniref:Galactose oxidase n=1 Tax=Rhizophagus irregularis TaxID=588596 RepID=A0A2I1G2S6_9GLOM|nr:galactose oxidase [Rhizophagus irregularis]CAB4426726.1 unnamed protein product [Rhizophagus irregularis]